jgi:membrane protein implicated in regulation of membrane protease activity
MLSLYLFALLVGGGLLVASMLGGGDHSHAGHDGDIGHDVGGHGNAAQFLSLRTITYFMFVFGGVGAVLTWKWDVAGILILALAAVAGLGVAAITAASFEYLRRTDSGGRDSEDSFVGLSGRVVVPIPSGGIGKVQVVRGDRTFELLARPLDDNAAGMSTWKSVIVVEMKRGTALVMPIDDPLLQQGS